MRTRPPYDLDVNRSMRVITGICMNVTDIADTAPLCCVRAAALGLDRTPGQVLACAFCARRRDNIAERFVCGGAMDRRHVTWDWLTRRAFLGTAAGAAAGVYGLSHGLAAEVPNTFDGKDLKLRAPEPNAKRGGVLRYGVPSAPAHFDVHQSGTVSNMGTQGAMYDNLIRRDPPPAIVARPSFQTWPTVGRLPRTAKPTRFSCARV